MVRSDRCGLAAHAGTADVGAPEDRGEPNKLASPADFPALQSDSRSVQRLAGSIADVLGELLETRRAVWQREAELAAGVPLVPHREEEKHLAAHAGGRTKSGREAVGGDAIALYLLDESTSELKLRSAWGLPFDRLVAAARPLQGAIADLEALLGHAVVLDNEQMMRDVGRARGVRHGGVRAGLNADGAAGNTLGILQRTARP